MKAPFSYWPVCCSAALRVIITVKQHISFEKRNLNKTKPFLKNKKKKKLKTKQSFFHKEQSYQQQQQRCINTFFWGMVICFSFTSRIYSFAFSWTTSDFRPKDRLQSVNDLNDQTLFNEAPIETDCLLQYVCAICFYIWYT